MIMDWGLIVAVFQVRRHFVLERVTIHLEHTYVYIVNIKLDNLIERIMHIENKFYMLVRLSMIIDLQTAGR